MTHAAIGKLGFKCECPGKFRSPISRSTYIDVQVEAVRLAAMTDLDEKSEGIKELVQYISRLDPIDQELAKSVVRKKLKLTASIFKKLDTVQAPVKRFDYAKENLNDILEMMRFGGSEDVGRAASFLLSGL